MTTGRINQVAIGRIGIRRLPRASRPRDVYTPNRATLDIQRSPTRAQGRRRTPNPLPGSPPQRGRRGASHTADFYYTRPDTPLRRRTPQDDQASKACIHVRQGVSGPKALGAAYRTPGDVTAGQPHICQETRSRTVIASYNHCRHL